MRGSASASDASAPLLPTRQRTVDAETLRQMDMSMQDILKKPEDAIGFIEACGVYKIGEMEIDVCPRDHSLGYVVV